MQTERTGGELLLSEVAAGKVVEDSMQLTTSIGIQSLKWGGVVERSIGREVRGVEQRLQDGHDRSAIQTGFIDIQPNLSITTPASLLWGMDQEMRGNGTRSPRSYKRSSYWATIGFLRYPSYIVLSPLHLHSSSTHARERVTMDSTMPPSSLETILQSPVQHLVVAILVAYVLTSILLGSFFLFPRPDHLPPFYSEPGYIPWLGSLVQFATGPRKFLQRAALAKGDVFTIQLFGKRMTFLTGSEGHAHFFKQREHVFDIREAYAMTVITFGPGVCYDCPQSKMAQQFAFFKDGLSDESFVKYMELVQDEVATFFEQEWGEEGEADLLQSLSDLYTLTSSRWRS